MGKTGTKLVPSPRGIKRHRKTVPRIGTGKNSVSLYHTPFYGENEEKISFKIPLTRAYKRSIVYIVYI